MVIKDILLSPIIMSILNSLIENTEKYSCIIIEDEICNRGIHLLKTFLHSAVSRKETVDAVHAVMLESYKDEILDKLPGTDNRLRLHDISSDPAGWISSTPEAKNIMGVDMFSLVSAERQESERIIVVMDGLSQLILHRGPAYTCHVINRLSQLRDKKGAPACQVIGHLHKDLHDEHTMNLLHYSASTIISIEAPRSVLFTSTCRILHKKLSGKVVRTVEEFKLGSDCTLEESRIVSDIKPTPTAEDPALDPAANLTFNLTLSESEKRARSEMHLPYMQHMKPRDAVQSGGGEAKIFYQPDDADDFDEEDPDDDLDI